MRYNLYRHDTPHRTVTANSTVLGEDAEGFTIAYDPLCAECNRIGFCTWDQGPCTINGPVLQGPEDAFHEPADGLQDDVARVTDAEEREALDVLYSYTEPCPMCGEVHPT